MLDNRYIHTLHACNIGYVTQAIDNNFAPLLFVLFREQFGFTTDMTAMLVMVNFTVQMCVAFFSAKLADWLSYRKILVIGQFCSALGLILLAFLPSFMFSKYSAITISIAIYAIGGGVIEAVDSPLIEACPFRRKAAVMSLVHAFYCWGQMIVVIGSTIFFCLFGQDEWMWLSCIWAMIPLVNAFYFMIVPMRPLVEDSSKRMGILRLLSTGVFWIFALMMLCAGASEHCMNQWASSFAERALHIDKNMGDLFGPCLFAFFMGLSRTLYAIFSNRLNILSSLLVSCMFCMIAYIMAGFAPHPGMALGGCALCGWSAGILWGGVFSVASKSLPFGGTAMFALLALPGDFGCGAGPMVVGFTSRYFFNDDLRLGIFSGIIFPMVMFSALLFFKYNYLPKHKEVKMPEA